MLWKITVQQRGNSNGFCAGESLGSLLIIYTSVVTMWQLIFFILNLCKSPLFPQKVIATKTMSPISSSPCWHTGWAPHCCQWFRCSCSEAGGGQSISRGCCCSWLTIPLPSSVTMLTDGACCHWYPWNKIVTLNPSNKMMKVPCKGGPCQWL